MNSMKYLPIGLREVKKMNNLNFPKSIYRKKDILRAIWDYQKICEIELCENSLDFICSFSKSKVDITMTIYEFANYLIELSNTRSEYP